ncbi:hypothetical protein [Sphingomonas sp.]|jgi:hypothetical protein|uniref:hypothetical protein n=1 Tax=Sphingomonas sp. TaxID=28214 RepID=UPI002E337A9A|nr:hypothetical protein [Sphingomonas sp.]HEX4694728.1 hypothetical protein [Sphingomonas sp.]
MPHPSAIALMLLASATAASAPVPAAPVDRIELAQVTVTGRIIIRVPSSRADAAAADLATVSPPLRWAEKKGPKCIVANQLAGAIVNDTDSVDLVLKGGARVRAQLDDDCAALGYYGGFYLKPSADGQVCAKRDAIRTRSGDSCPIGRFRRLVAKPGKARKP